MRYLTLSTQLAQSNLMTRPFVAVTSLLDMPLVERETPAGTREMRTLKRPPRDTHREVTIGAA